LAIDLASLAEFRLAIGGFVAGGSFIKPDDSAFTFTSDTFNFSSSFLGSSIGGNSSFFSSDFGSTSL
jgi:hypothetical protein